MYQALYRKYRPKTFEDVVGQEHITTTLKNEIAGGKPSHAYLFTGSRGTGKTTCSKILAKAVNCPNQAGGNPCGVCDICRGIEDGSILDVVEIDAASNNGVDNIRDLRDEANFTPAVAKYRVYIIDEAHMLSTGAFNALLKIMEEPPEHVIFILATTEVHKIPATVLSRCQRFDFKRISGDELSGRLQYVAQQEGFALAEDAALLIARLSDGGMRDAISLLDLCSSYSHDITLSTVADAAGVVGQGHLFSLDEAIASRDPAQALAQIEALGERSVDPERLCEQLIGHFRDLMIASSVADPGPLLTCMPSEQEQLKTHAKAFPMGEILYILTVLQDCLGRMAKTTLRKTELEMAAIRLCSPQLSTLPEGILARLERLERALTAGAFPQGGQAPAPLAKEASAAPKAAEEPAGGGGEDLPSPTAEIPPPPTPKEEKVAVPFGPWQQVLERLEQLNGALYGALSGSSAYECEGVLLIDCKNPMFLSLIRDNDYSRKSIRQAVMEVTGRKLRLGPYKPEQYQTKPSQPDPLEDFLNNLSLPQESVEIL